MAGLSRPEPAPLGTPRGAAPARERPVGSGLQGAGAVVGGRDRRDPSARSVPRNRVGPEPALAPSPPDGATRARRARGVLGRRSGHDGPADRRGAPCDRRRGASARRERPALLLRDAVEAGARNALGGVRAPAREGGEREDVAGKMYASTNGEDVLS